MQTPKNKVLLKLDKLYTDELILEGGLKLYLDPTFRPEWNVTVSGTISALPKDGLMGLRLGERVFFSYNVVNERKWEDDRKFFVRNNVGNEMMREYTDKMGGTIKVVAFHGAIKKNWGATYVDEFGRFVDGCQGDEEDIDRWLAANFKFGYAQDMIYKNLVHVDGYDFWMAEAEDIFAVKRKGKLVATKGYAICKPIKIDISKRIAIEKGIFLPTNAIVAVPQDRAKVITMGKCADNYPVSAEDGDVVKFENRMVEKYTFEGENYFVVKHNRILGKV